MKSLLQFIVVIFFALGLIGCNNKADWPAGPEYTAWQMKLAIDNKDYESFNDLFTDERKDSLSKEEFSALREITTAGSEYKNYEVITFENGQMLLVLLAPPNEDNEVKIEDVIVVPENMRQLFRN